MSDYYYDEDKTIGGFAKQIVKLNEEIESLKLKNKELESELQARDKLPIPKGIVRQVIQMEAVIKKLKEDLSFYKKYVSSEIIINREKNDSPRRGGLPK